MLLQEKEKEEEALFVVRMIIISFAWKMRDGNENVKQDKTRQDQDENNQAQKKKEKSFSKKKLVILDGKNHELGAWERRDDLRKTIEE